MEGNVQVQELSIWGEIACLGLCLFKLLQSACYEMVPMLFFFGGEVLVMLEDLQIVTESIRREK